MGSLLLQYENSSLLHTAHQLACAGSTSRMVVAGENSPSPAISGLLGPLPLAMGSLVNRFVDGNTILDAQ
jgi:hypothetical protein